jgi:hypothetical protein
MPGPGPQHVPGSARLTYLRFLDLMSSQRRSQPSETRRPWRQRHQLDTGWLDRSQQRRSLYGGGCFTQAQVIVRMGTTGGTAPGDGCDEARAGQELRVPYTAIYVFLK